MRVLNCVAKFPLTEEEKLIFVSRGGPAGLCTKVIKQVRASYFDEPRPGYTLFKLG